MSLSWIKMAKDEPYTHHSRLSEYHKLSPGLLRISRFNEIIKIENDSNSNSNIRASII